jgi:hypothetical protein
MWVFTCGGASARVRGRSTASAPIDGQFDGQFRAVRGPGTMGNLRLSRTLVRHHRRVGPVVRHWWNGWSGQAVRRDLFVHGTGDRWTVEARTGNEQPRSRVHVFATVDQALALARRWLDATDDDWIDLSDTYPRR